MKINFCKKYFFPFIYFVFFSFCLSIFFSCNFLVTEDLEEGSSQTQTDSHTLTFGVNPLFNDESLLTRSAYPDFSTIDLSTGYTFSASCAGIFRETDSSGSYDSATGKITYTVTSQTFSNQTVNFYINNSSGENLWSSSATLSYSSYGASIGNLSLNFSPCEITTNGYINGLTVTTSSGYKVVCEIEGDTENAITIPAPATSITLATGTGGIAPGSYRVTFSIYASGDINSSGVISANAIIRDLIIQTINVWPGLTTNKWYLSNGNTSQTFNIPISDNAVKLYVKGTNCQGIYKTGNDLANVEASPTNSGSIAHPVSTLQAAIDKCTSSATAYTIVVDGTVTGTSTISNTVAASSLTITGSTSAAVIKGYTTMPSSAGNSTLSVNAGSADFPLTISDITITGGFGTYGGGIDIQKGTVTLADGVKIYGNKAETAGGGVAVRADDATLYMIGNSLIGYDTTTDSYPTSSTLGTGTGKAANYAPKGGGIFQSAGKVCIGCDSTGNVTDAYRLNANYGIRQNFASNGAGIQSQSGTIYMGSGSIAYNAASMGGGIYLLSTLNMTGGEIKSNNASTGGAVYHTGTFNISGSASIPYGVGSTTGKGKNDVYLYGALGIFVAADFTSDAPSTVAYITPSEWKRGSSVIKKGAGISSLTNAMLSKFKTIDSDFTIESFGNFGVLAAPIYVAGEDAVHCTGTPGTDTTARGTSESPYSSIAYALSAVTSTATTITVDGKLTGSQTIETFPSSASSVTAITLTGYIPSGSTSSAAYIDGNNSGSALTINTDKKVTITNFKITNGNANGATSAKQNGGGINIINNNAEVVLGSGTVITANNAASFGGGVYLTDSGDASLKIDGATISKNNAYCGGGVFADENSTFTFESGMIGGSTSSDGNSAAESGGGIYSSIDGTFNMTGGSVKYNKITGSASLYNQTGGGGMYVAGEGAISSGYIQNNSATNSMGGGIYAGCPYDSELTGDVVISGNSAKWGGGIYQECTLVISGGTFSANTSSVAGGALYAESGPELKNNVIFYTANDEEKKNDIYLEDGMYIAATTLSQTTVATITPQYWNRGTQVLSSSSYNSKFKISDPEWSLVAHDSKGKIDADLYVATTASTTTVSGVAYGKGAAPGAGGRGTIKKPYSTIDDAVAQCWGGPNDKGTNVNRIINIVGTLAGAHNVPDSLTTDKATAISLKGINTSATLNGGFSATTTTKKSTLTLSTAVPVTIQNLKITGGYASGSTAAEKQGGGVNITAGTVTMSSNVEVYSNYASNGCGVYVADGARLDLISTDVKIHDNGASSNLNGGGIYNAGTLDMRAGNIYSNTSGEQYNGGYGGGVYNSGTFYMSGTSNIYSNISGEGGGVFTSGTFTMGASASNANAGLTGSIYLNQAIEDDAGSGGGGVSNTGTMIMKAGTIGGSSENKNSTLYNGGGIYSKGSLTISGGTISFNEVTDEYIGGCGGGVCSYNSGSEFNMTGGFINDNTAKGDGGGIYITGHSFTMSGGQIYNNKANKNGGGIYSNRNVYIYGSALIGDSDDSFTEPASAEEDSSNYAGEKGGGIYLTSSNSSLNLGYKGDPSVSTNKVSLTGGIYHCFAIGDGGGIYCNGGKINMASGTIKLNGGNLGGGLNVENVTSFSITGGTFSTNRAYVNGGGIYALKTSITISGTNFENNKALTSAGSGQGGGIYVDSSSNPSVSIGSGTKFNNNTAGTNGGAFLCSSSGGISMTGVVFGDITENSVIKTSGNGGAIYAGKSITLSGCTIHAGSNRHNDVFLINTSTSSGGTTIVISGAPGNTTTNKCAVTLSNCQAGSIILTGTSTYFNRFVLTNSGYTIGTSGKAE